jgi:hypothetical protein
VRRVIPVLIVAVDLCTHHNTFHCPFIFNNNHVIVKNHYLRQLWPPHYSTLVLGRSKLATSVIARIPPHVHCFLP